MKAQLMGAVIALSLAAMVLAGCSDDSPGEATPSAEDAGADLSGIDLTADVDPEAGTVILPIGRFMPTPDENATVSIARETAVTVCARDKGVAWPRVEKWNPDPTAEMYALYGPWTQEIAEKFAFAGPQSDDSLIRNMIVEPPAGYEYPDQSVYDDGLTYEVRDEAMGSCIQTDDVQQFEPGVIDNSGPWDEEIWQAEEAALLAPDAKEAFRDLKVCYADAGLTYDEQRPGFVEGVKTEPDQVESSMVMGGVEGTVSEPIPGTVITEEQVAMALKVAECQQSTDFTNRIADIYVLAQAPVIEKYAVELTDGREKIDALIEDATAYMAAHPEAFEDPTQ
ncbi:MAG: hypothetical protein ACTHW1_09120 [Ancrocorticia sp.]|uniref:hypothetical protein n=1 Tax=Ancrocorticia sp. TaxID=2593684 RepID=UPI003F8FD3E9